MILLIYGPDPLIARLTLLPRSQSGTFQVDRAFGPDDSTEQVFEAAVQPLVPWAWGGGVGIMFAYGQTGSGKTFTVSGLEQLVAGSLLDGDLEGERKIFVCIVELAGNAAFGKMPTLPPIQVSTYLPRLRLVVTSNQSD